MNELVRKLSEGDHKVIIRPEGDDRVKALKNRIENYKYVLIKFTETQGGTELGVQLDQTRSDLSKADFQKGTGTAHFVGELVLDYVLVRLVADIALENFEGTGHLEILQDPAPPSSERKA